ncbi:MAG: SoxR reducing system RseC family protein [Alistipes sp.]|nr:SoxR reducing system RseC family protein [Alistipes senegalensis]MCM1250004.1 SoxR reducing system RseC family protein [Alistipes sp.]
MATELIEHSGVVERTEAGRVYVRIVSRSACGTCSARRACGLAETQEKIVEVPTPEAAQYRPGEEVLVGMKRRAGLLSVALAYGGALAVLLAVLLLTIGAGGWNQAAGALAALGSVVLYYMVLWLCRRKIEHTIQFTITKN